MILDEIALSMQRGINPKTAAHLVGVFGDASSVYAATLDELTGRAELRPDIARGIAMKESHVMAEEELRFCSARRLKAIGFSSGRYPPLLRECCDHPMVLYVAGDPDALAGKMLAVVGTRKITPYGSAVCRKLVGGLAGAGQRLTIVSGLAYGVDVCAHKSALEAGLPTVAVLGNRLPNIYPVSHTDLARAIISKGGCVVSEMHSRSVEGKMNFVSRNRIVAGMCRGTVIVESPAKGGSMITAEMAAGYDRAVMAVPGRITDEMSSGTNALIRDMKAAPVISPEDILQELSLDTGYGKSLAQQSPNEEKYEGTDAASVVMRLAGRDGGATVDMLADRTSLPAQQLLALLFELEMAGKVCKSPGGIYIRIR